MAKVSLSKKALRDLNSIYLYISQDSEFYAGNLVNKIYARIKILETHIPIGKVVSEFNDQAIRELQEGQYRIIYKVINANEVSIVRVYHRARLLTNL